MIDLLMQWAGPALAGLVAFAALIYGPLKKRQGRREARNEIQQEDQEMAQEVSRRADLARERAASDKRSADDRLRARGSLRDE